MKRPFLWVLIAWLCWDPSTPLAQQTGNIEGVVLDEATEAPIADVSVVLSATGQRVSTDQDGALIATAYVVQERIANEDLMQGVLMKPTPKPTLKRRSRPRVAKTTILRKAVAWYI